MAAEQAEAPADWSMECSRSSVTINFVNNTVTLGGIGGNKRYWPLSNHTKVIGDYNKVRIWMRTPDLTVEVGSGVV